MPAERSAADGNAGADVGTALVLVVSNGPDFPHGWWLVCNGESWGICQGLSVRLRDLEPGLLQIAVHAEHEELLWQCQRQVLLRRGEITRVKLRLAVAGEVSDGLTEESTTFEDDDARPNPD